ncbi:DNA translocase FtsK [Lichenicola sp.]|uniref:DNA translocase FtsK n=1 Tax=Lichenicola sp. TaxID=2804529 RepID=UPI003AFFCD4A
MQIALPSRFISERLASPQLQALIRRRLAELGGVVLAAVAIAMLVALVSYNPRDPSPDTATMVATSNLAGPVGAAFADLMLQYFGLAGLLPVLAMLAWAWRIASRGGLGSLTLRVVALVFVLPVAATVLAGVAILLPHMALPGPVQAPAAWLPAWLHTGWPGAAGAGGAVGLSLGQASIEAGRGALGPFGGVLVWLLTVALAILLVPLCLGLSAREWRAVGRGAHRTARYPIARARRKTGDDGSQSRSLMSRFRSQSNRAATQRSLADEDDFDHVMPGESPFAAEAMRASGGARARTAASGFGALVAQEPTPAARQATARARSADRQEPSLAGRRAEKSPPRPKLGSSGWVLPPGAPEEPDDMPALPLKSRTAMKASRAATPELPPIRLGAPTEAPAAVAEPTPAPAMPRASDPKAGSMITRLLGTRSEPSTRAPAAGTVPPQAAPRPEPSRRVQPDDGQWRLPPLSLLQPAPPRAATGPSNESMQANARLLETVLSDYGVQGAIGDIHAGPVVTLYELEPAPGIRSARVIGLADDIARSLSVTAVRIATVPGRNVIGIEVPNAKRETVYFSELLDRDDWIENPARLCLALGKDISGAPVYADLARMPHLLIAGTTGSGKSVGINSMILSLLYRLSPEECRLIMIDPKMLELSIYDGIPHLMAPVVTDPAKAVMALKWTVREMERRYRGMSQLGVRNIAGYNERTAAARASGETMTRKVQTGFDPETGRPIFEEQNLSLEALPYIVVVIDEMADLMMVAGKEIETTVQRLAQMARAAGIHVIMATQRPSVDVITGTIKANFPTRISFQVISKFDSRTILGEQGSEQLLGQGDMLYMAGGGRITRVHGPFVGDLEVEEVVRHLRAQGEPVYVDEVTSLFEDEGSSSGSGGSGSGNGLGGGGFDGDTALFDQAVALVAREGKASTSFIQRHLSIGYNRAAKLIEQMEKDGIVSSANHVGKREVLVRRTPDED